MEGPAKERLTGALILIAVLVIVVPEMLSGPDAAKSRPGGAETDAGPPLRTYQLQLDTPSAARNEDQSALSPKSGDTPSPPAADVAPVAQVQPQAQASAPQAVEVPTAEAGPKVVAGSGNWWAQLGSFSARDNAERLAQKLRGAGYPVSVSPIKVNGKELFRVRAGPVETREAAAELQSRLAAAGHKSSLVPP